MIIKLDRFRAVNTDHIVSARIDTYGDTILHVELVTGEKVQMRHTPHCFDGVDVYALFDRITAAQE
ncbi:TPA: hypothetical protein QDB24_002210 [Burkholderia vietnamiensis]|uniref:hypothetical protein n=1 Tax=Burkholderia vietnamiensis TaxID=60552 RepID=UPI0015932F5C|nr:hypothetical protein [Burkholderia vietnamiensis]MBR7910110.1 hypothetical protein [Burkholderia vietnamiensis]HDR9102986.1 hypothetical protein [Burkholderia vietnamiensis]HDR9274150.1 hypothetical protein [Burkholderia vietnamiensis]